MNIETRKKLALNEVERGDYKEAASIFASILDYDPNDHAAWIYFGFCELCVPIYQHIDKAPSPQYLVSSIFKCFLEGLSHIENRQEKIYWKN